MVASPSTLGKLVQLAYLPAFLTAPEGIGAAAERLGFQVVAILIGRDLDGRRPYGFIARDAANNFVVVFRGTDDFWEWVEDARILPRWVPSAGIFALAERGFTGVAWSIRTADGHKVAQFLAQTPHASVTVVGHSLGAAVAVEIARQVKADALVCFAPPKTGNSAYAAAVRRSVGEIVLFVNPEDAVPKVPLGYQQPAQVRPEAFRNVGHGLSEQHSIVHYTDFADAALAAA